MTEPCYSFRANLFTPERTYRIGADALRWTSGGQEGRIGFGDVCEVRLRRQSLPGEMAIRQRTMSRVEMRCSSGRRLTLSPLHYAGFRTWEDRSTPYVAFVSALLTRLRDRNAELKVVSESHWTWRLRTVIARGLQAFLGRFGENLLNLVRKLGLDRAARLGGALMRSIGPWLGAHRVARANLKAAFPEKSPREIDRLLRGVWDNFGRVVGEYAFLDQLYNYDPLKPHKWIVIDRADVDRVREIRAKAEPVLFFGAHMANWELPGLITIAHGIDFTGVYRPPDAASLDQLVAKLRGGFMKLIPAQLGAALHIHNALLNGSSIGMLVDQHFADGADVLFFGRPCKVNPMLARLARKYNCPIHGSRAVRLADGRLRLEVTEPLKLPRDANGKVDVAATMQLITWVVEGWVREHPEQWLWLHRRWR
jgi:Kdo2-lipid IVA lauroyltransferase/acyltransferase